MPTESKLIGSWEVEAPPPKKLIYTFQKDHTYTMTVTGQAGAMQGTWRLGGNFLVMTLGSFAAYGMTNTMPVVKGMSTQKNTVVKLTDSAMAWRSVFLEPGLKFKRVPTLPPVNWT